MITIHVLVLGDEERMVDGPTIEGVEFKFTCETAREIHGGEFGSYIVSARSLRLAAEASPEKYDAIIIGNNLGTGIPKAEAVPEAMKARTMIVWNEYVSGNERPYAERGFTRFGSRYKIGRESVFAMADFLKEIAEEKLART